MFSSSKDKNSEKPRNGNKITMKISKFRIVASQLIGTLTVNLTKFTTGSSMGFTTIFLGELAKENTEINVTFDELTWYSKYKI